MTTPELRLFFDGKCAFCNAEMTRLRHWDTTGRLAFVDISVPGFDPAPLGFDMRALNRELHGRRANGEVLVGIDCMLAAYTLAGKGWLVFPLRVQILRPGLAYLYRKFARHRYRFSRWLGYRTVPACDNGVCHAGNPFIDR